MWSLSYLPGSSPSSKSNTGVEHQTPSHCLERKLMRTAALVGRIWRIWAYPHRFWLETHRDRQAIITFEREEAPSEAEVYGHFNRGSPEMHSLESVRVKPLHAMLFFYTSAAAQQLIQKEPPSFDIGGKTVRAKWPD
ncbi:hypothetical protein ACLB2K_027760 [Fragaria x ananassa]